MPELMAVPPKNLQSRKGLCWLGPVLESDLLPFLSYCHTYQYTTSCIEHTSGDHHIVDKLHNRRVFLLSEHSLKRSSPRTVSLDYPAMAPCIIAHAS